jgi:hypothetical protein
MHPTRLAAALALLLLPLSAASQDAVRGAGLYLRTDSDERSCFGCHGPDPSQGRNNILLAAGNPTALDKALVNVGAMGYLGQLLAPADRLDIAAYLDGVAWLHTAGAALQAWPPTLDFGQLAAGSASAVQQVELRNPSTRVAVPLTELRLTGTDGVLDHDCPSLLPAGAACALRVRVVPGAPGLLRGALQVRSPLLVQPVVVGWLARVGGTPRSQLAWRDAPSRLALDAAGARPVTRSLELLNPGPADAQLDGVVVSGPQAAAFATEGCAAGTVLAAGTSCTLDVRFRPGALTAAAATLQLRSDQANPPSIRLAATAPAPEAVALESAIEAAALPSGGGSCSAGPPSGGPRDPVLALGAVLAALLAWARGGRAGRRR